MSDDVVTMTEAAAKKVAQVIAEDQVSRLDKEDLTELKLRVYIEGGGCNGMQYGFTLEKNVNEDDFTYVYHGVTLLIDTISHQYLLGAEIDYQDDKLNGSRFIIHNPSAQHTCGCGSSFSG